MRGKWTIWGLALATVVVIGGLIIWQLSILPDTRTQIASGLNASLERIGKQSMEELEAAYVAEILSAHAQIRTAVSSEQDLEALRDEIWRLTAAHPLMDAWLVSLMDSLPHSWEYKSPGRFRQNPHPHGSWREETELSEFVSEFLRNNPDQVAATIAERGYFYLPYQTAFQTTWLLGQPRFQGQTIQSVIWSKTDIFFLEDEWIPRFMRQQYARESGELEGIQFRHLRWGVRKRDTQRLVFHSQKLAPSAFTYMASGQQYLPTYQMGIALQGGTVASVAASIFRRNLYLVGGLLALLVLLLVLIFRMAFQLSALSRLKSQFVANVSHELKTPLSGMRLAIQTLQLGRFRDADQQRDILSHAAEEGERLQAQIDQLLEFSSMESGKRQFDRRDFPLQEWLPSLRRLITYRGGSHVELDLPGAAAARLHADQAALEQVLTILLDNARKYGPSDGLIRVVLKVDDHHIFLSVTDQGPGVPKAQRKQIFTPFFRGEGGDVHTVKGHGLGLSIAQHIVQAHQGQLHLECPEAGGSTFTLQIPILT